MFTIIGFVLFMLPILGVGVCGITRLIKTVGKTATIILGISLPFYAITIKTLFGVVTQMVQDILNHTNSADSWNLSSFEWISIGCFIILFTLFLLLARTHVKKHGCLEN